MRRISAAVALAIAAATLVAATRWTFAPPSPFFAEAAGGRVDPSDVYNPVTAGEPLPDGFRQLLPRDAIRPIYEPQFTTADGVEWPDDTQVIGVAVEGEAKAYPVSVLDQHEMVNDVLAGEPILVTW